MVVQQTAFRPAELNVIAQRGVTAQGLVPGVQVAMGGPATVGSGITIGIVELPTGRTLEQFGTEFAQALQRSDAPISVEVSAKVVPISG